MYYILNASNQPEGPYPAEWIRSHAHAETLVSRGQMWIKYSAHPDFSSMMSPLPPVPVSSQLPFQHPLDVAAIRVLSHTPGLDVLAKVFSGALIERLMNIELVGHAVRVSESQYPEMYSSYLTAAQRLFVPRMPELYVKRGGVNAFSVGIEKYYIVVETGLLDILDPDELTAVLAHELGHVRCEHMKYLTMVTLLRQFGQVLLDIINVPLAPALLMGVQAALLQWYQKSELSADRAALVVTRDVSVVERVLSKLTGYSPGYRESLNIEELKRQATQFDEIGATSVVEKALKVWALLQLTHPVPILRIREIGSWAQTPEYLRIVDQNDSVVAVDHRPPCSHCGNEIDSTASFCTNCGADLRSPSVSAESGHGTA